MIGHRVLTQQGKTVAAFHNNIPGSDWGYSFLKQNAAEITQCHCQNMKHGRAEVSAKTISVYFNNLEESLLNVEPQALINYDETNLSDEPGKKRCIFKRGTKYLERIRNHSKGSTSIMFAGTASGKMLPMYTVYKAEHLWHTWMEGGPTHTRYNRSKSGWFDHVCFNDWFNTIILPYVRSIDGPKVLIGDNLSSHLNESVIQKCKEHNIRFVFLPGKQQTSDTTT